MSMRNLGHFFHPDSVALVGASARPGSIGATVLARLLSAGFAGPVWPVNPKYRQLLGLEVFAGVTRLPRAPALAVVCTPAATVPRIIGELGALGCRAAIVLGAGMDAPGSVGGEGGRLRQAMLDAARPHLMRILGPNSLGLLAPGARLDASFAAGAALPGRLAFVSESGAMASAVLDWARERGIGFSCFVSLGDSLDVDLADLLDYLGDDAGTDAILVYAQHLGRARKFMSAARGAARAKPTVIVKAGRAAAGIDTGSGADGAPAGADLVDVVVEAALRRAGMLRVQGTVELFDAAAVLAHRLRTGAGRLAIVSNGVGPALLAADALVAAHGTLARLGEATLARLDAVLPANWRRANGDGGAVDIGADAPAERCRQALQALLASPDLDAVLLIHAPNALVPAAEVARALLPLLRAPGRPVLCCWLGGASVAQARRLCLDAGLPVFDTPEEAVRALMQLVDHARNQALSMQAPAADGLAPPDRAGARARVVRLLAAGSGPVDEAEAMALLACYGIAAIPREAATDTAGAMAGAPALRVELALDPAFGPVVLFGQGGLATEAAPDRAAGLPPLDRVLARDVIAHTRVGRLLAGGGAATAAVDALADVLVRVGQMAIDLPDLCALDIDPLLADGRGVRAARVRLRLAPAGAADPLARLAILPYPDALERRVETRVGPLTLRPIRPGDAPAHQAFFRALSPQDVHFRMFASARELSDAQLARFTQIDYAREMAFILSRAGPAGEETLGVARVVADPDNVAGEFAVVVRSDLQGLGLGTLLMQALLDYCRARGLREIVGSTLAENLGMQALARRLGFALGSEPGGTVTLRRALGADGRSPDEHGQGA